MSWLTEHVQRNCRRGRWCEAQLSHQLARAAVARAGRQAACCMLPRAQLPLRCRGRRPATMCGAGPRSRAGPPARSAARRTRPPAPPATPASPHAAASAPAPQATVQVRSLAELRHARRLHGTAAAECCGADGLLQRMSARRSARCAAGGMHGRAGLIAARTGAQGSPR
jgi:hypothetical protein